MAEDTGIAEDLTEEELADLLEKQDSAALVAVVRERPADELVQSVSALGVTERRAFWEQLIDADEALAADVTEHFPEVFHADLLTVLPPDRAAQFVSHIDSDEQVDLLSHLDRHTAEQILKQMPPKQTADIRRRLSYERYSAGGIMITEIIQFSEEMTRDDITDDLRAHYEEHRVFEHRYIFLKDAEGRFSGLVPMRRLVYSPADVPLSQLKVDHIEPIGPELSLDELLNIFDRVDFSVLPVLGPDGKLMGAVNRAITQEALAERQEAQLMEFGGIIGGEELRTMAFRNRVLKRLAFLMPSVLLSYLAVSVIAVFEPVIEQITALAIFLPMVANLSGAAGNQAVAVSIRELTLGVINERQVLRVWKNEVWLGLVNGFALGLILGVVTFLTRMDDPLLGVVVGIAYMLSSVLAVSLGGLLPLFLKRLRVDPAMLSSPMLTTLTDMISFFLVLSLAAGLLLSAAG